MTVKAPSDAVRARIAEEGVAGATETHPGIRLQQTGVVTPALAARAEARLGGAFRKRTQRAGQLSDRTRIKAGKHTRAARFQRHARIHTALFREAHGIHEGDSEPQIEIPRPGGIDVTEAVKTTENIRTAAGDDELTGTEAVVFTRRSGDGVDIDAGQIGHGADRGVRAAHHATRQILHAGSHHREGSAQDARGRQNDIDAFRSHRAQAGAIDAGGDRVDSVDGVVGDILCTGRLHRLVEQHTHRRSIHAACGHHGQGQRSHGEGGGSAGDGIGRTNHGHAILREGVGGQGGGHDVLPVARARDGTEGCAAVRGLLPLIAVRTIAIHHRVERPAPALGQRQVLRLLHEGKVAGRGPHIGIVADIHTAVLKAAQGQIDVLHLDHVRGVRGGTHGQDRGSRCGAQRPHVLQHAKDAEIAHHQVCRVGEADGQPVPVTDRQTRRLREDGFLKTATAAATLGAEFKGVGRRRRGLENHRHERLRNLVA